MDAGSRRINDILNGSRLLEIPFFQRSYVWEEPLLERFLESMREASIPNNSYFFGTLILKQSSTSSSYGIGDVRTVIDGQQRITTFLLFLKILCVKSNAQREFERVANVRGQLSVRHNFMDRECFEQIMNQDELRHVNYNSRLSNAYNYFLEKVDSENYNLFNILDNIIFVGIDLLPHEKEQVIFDTINSLGVSLTTGELLKNHIFSASTIDSYNTIWKPVFEEDEDVIGYWNKENTLGRLKRINLETFLYAYLHIKINDPNLNLNTSEKSKFRSAEDLFNQYKLYLRLSQVDLIDFARDLTNYAKLYQQFISSDILDEEVPRGWGIERLNAVIFGLDTTTLIPYLLFVLKNQPDISEIKSICHVLESYIMRRIICKSGNDNYSDLFSLNLISNRILSSDGLIDYLLRKENNSSLAMPNDVDLHYAFKENVLTNPRAKGVLYLLESLIRAEYQATSLKSYNSYSLEHLMPKKWHPSVWPLISGYESEDRNQVLKTLGNLSILPSKLNSSLSNKSWNDKKKSNKGLKSYASGIETLCRWLDCPTWNELKINERAEWLFNHARSVWRFGEDYHNSNDFSFVSENNIFSEIHSASETTLSQGIETQEESEEQNPGRDKTKYYLFAEGPFNKREFVFRVIKKYISDNPQIAFEELKAIFPDSIMERQFVRKGLIASVDALLDGEMPEKQLNKSYNFDKPDKRLSVNGTEFFVNNQHTKESADRMAVVAMGLGYDVTSTNEIRRTSNSSSVQSDTNRSQQSRLRVTFADGEIIEKPNAIDTLESTISRIGVDRVASLNIVVYRNYPLLSTSFINKKLQRKFGNRFYLFKNSSTETKKEQLEEIANRLNISGLIVELIPKSAPFLV